MWFCPFFSRGFTAGWFFCWILLQAQYLLVLCSFKEQLQQHVRVHAVEAVVACREIENTLQAITGMFTFCLSQCNFFLFVLVAISLRLYHK